MALKNYIRRAPPGTVVRFVDGVGHGYAEVLRYYPGSSYANDVVDLLTYGPTRQLYTRVPRGTGPSQWEIGSNADMESNDGSFNEQLAIDTEGDFGTPAAALPFVDLEGEEFTDGLAAGIEEATVGDPPAGEIAEALGANPTKAEFDALVQDYNNAAAAILVVVPAVQSLIEHVNLQGETLSLHMRALLRELRQRGVIGDLAHETT